MNLVNKQNEKEFKSKLMWALDDWEDRHGIWIFDLEASFLLVPITTVDKFIK